MSLFKELRCLSSAARALALLAQVLLITALFIHHDALAAPSLKKHSLTAASGRIRIDIVDTFHGKDRQLIYLVDHHGRKNRLHLSGASRELRSGDYASVRGRKLRNNSLLVRSNRDLKVQKLRTAYAVTGTRKIALIRIQALDGGPSCSSSQMIDRMWTGTRSINGLYQASSFGQINFAQDSNSDGQADVFQANINETTLGRCTQYASIAASADAALVAAGINLSGYNHRVYLLPTNVRYSQLDPNGNPVLSSELATQCYWAGMATIGGQNAWIPGEWCGVTDDSIDVIAHEVGHNLGLNHAHADIDQNGITDSPDGEYSDISCPMGRANRNYRHFNAVHKIQMGWTSSIEPVHSSGVHTVSAIESPNPSIGAPHALVMTTRLGNLYVSYRAALDAYNSNWQSAYYGKTSIHWGTAAPGPSNFIAMLGDGQSYRDPDTGTVISQISHSASTAQISITFGPVAPAPPTNLTVQ